MYDRIRNITDRAYLQTLLCKLASDQHKRIPALHSDEKVEIELPALAISQW